MPPSGIQPLSDATSRALTSAQSLNDAASVVKELVENALDARASVISVEIATNTLDKIIVKDDGSGIGVEDRQLLCKRGYTSKIGTLDDLANLGGSFLGFRGTALASIAELSEEITVITKVDGEQPATSMTFNSRGELLISGSASHNDGTTVRVENFLASIPVRRHVVLKHPSKTLDDIKRLLQGYALARPSVKLSLRVLRAKNDKANWSFASCRGEEPLLAAAAQVVGKNVVSLCTLGTAELDAVGEAGAKYAITALLLKPGTDIYHTSGAGQYISVDGRPVHHDKGVMKDLTKRYKLYLTSVGGSTNRVPLKPFITLHLCCPSRSYDVNVEPAKDVVLFHHEATVLDLAEKLFVECYGDLEQPQVDRRQDATTASSGTGTSSFDVLLARKPSDSSMTRGHTLAGLDFGQEEDEANPADHSTSSQRHSLPGSPVSSLIQMPSPLENVAERRSVRGGLHRWTPSKVYHDMSEMFLEPEEGQASGNRPDEFLVQDEVYNHDDVSVNNPFIRAKAYSLARPPAIANGNSQTVGIEADGSAGQTTLRTMSMNNGSQSKQPSSSRNTRHLPTPTTSPVTSGTQSYQNPGPPFPRRSKHGRDQGASDNGDDLEERSLHDSPQRHIERLGRAMPLAFHENPFQSASDLIVSNPLTGHHVSPSSHESGNSTLLVRGARHQGLLNKPFQSPLKTLQPMISSNVMNNSLGRADLSPKLSDGRERLSSLAVHADDDLNHILDFEKRKKLVNQREKQRQATLNPADLARIQKRSLAAIDVAPSQPSIVERGVGEDVMRISRDAINARFGEAEDSSQSAKSRVSNPHRNRYLAAVRNLERDKGSPNPVMPLGREKINPEVDGSLQSPEDVTTIPPTDPRGYLISLQQQNSLSDPVQLVIKRGKTSRLPFETIPQEYAKHNIRANPTRPFPTPDELSHMCKSYKVHDEYIKTGKVEPATWSPTGKHIEHWQQTLQGLVTTNYRARATNLTGEDGPDQIPNVQLNLPRAIKAHLDLAG